LNWGFRALGGVWVGDASGFTNYNAANLVGALPAIDGSALTGIASGIPTLNGSGTNTTLRGVTAVWRPNEQFSDGERHQRYTPIIRPESTR